jgi:hypothetical protein
VLGDEDMTGWRDVRTTGTNWSSGTISQQNGQEEGVGLCVCM